MPEDARAIVNVQTSRPSEYARLTIYPPDLIYNLLKSTFIGTIASFGERIVNIFK